MADLEIPLTIATDFHIQDDGRLVVNRTADVEPIMEHAKELQRSGLHTTGQGDKHAASFDPLIVEMYCNQNGITFAEWCADPAHVRRMLNDPALSQFRVWPGRV